MTPKCHDCNKDQDECSCESIEVITRQRDELLAFVQEWLDRQGTDENYMVAKARAAIASVKGGAA